MLGSLLGFGKRRSSSSRSRALLLFLVTGTAVIFPSFSRSDDEPGAEPATEPATEPPPETAGAFTDPAGGTLPAIEAKAYDLKVIRPSHSGRIYLLQKADQQMPDLGRIFLLREGGEAVMGFRVVKTYPENAQIAAKKVREYLGHESLAPESKYRAYEKVGDILSVPAKTAQDVEDLKDLENGGSEPKETAATTEPALEEKAKDSDAKPSVEETAEVDETAFRDEGEVDYFPNWLTLDLALIPNKKIPGPSFKKGIGLTYGRNIVNGMFRSSSDYPDTLTLEAGFFYYKTTGEINDVATTFTMLPFRGLIRYTIPTSESFSFYLYGGFLYNYVMDHLNASEADITAATGLSPALGLGGLIQFGPNWYLKLNLGLETIGTGIVLRF